MTTPCGSPRVWDDDDLLIAVGTGVAVPLAGNLP